MTVNHLKYVSQAYNIPLSWKIQTNAYRLPLLLGGVLVVWWQMLPSYVRSQAAESTGIGISV